MAIDLTRELGQRLGVPVTIVAYDSVAVMVDAAKTGAWDIAFLGIDPAREGEIGFTAAYLEIEATYLVPAASPLRAVSDVDREGVRVAAPARANYELYLGRHLRRAELVRAANAEAAFNLLATGQAEVLAGLRQALSRSPSDCPGRACSTAGSWPCSRRSACREAATRASRTSAGWSRTRRPPGWSRAPSSGRARAASRWPRERPGRPRRDDPRFPLRHRLEGRPHGGADRARAPGRLPGHRHREPAAALLRGRRRAGARRRLPRGGGHAGGALPADEVHLPGRPGPPAALRPRGRSLDAGRASRWRARSSTSGPTTSTATCCTAPPPAAAGRPTTPRCGPRWCGSATPAARGCSA